MADEALALVQGGTRLFLLDVAVLSRDLFYQQARPAPPRRRGPGRGRAPGAPAPHTGSHTSRRVPLRADRPARSAHTSHRRALSRATTA
jgi:hypothetical protein